MTVEPQISITLPWREMNYLVALATFGEKLLLDTNGIEASRVIGVVVEQGAVIKDEGVDHVRDALENARNEAVRIARKL